jgi:membrane protease subunit HflK
MTDNEDHTKNIDEHAHRDPAMDEAPLDAANQSLADALRASFRILKGIMIVLVALYLISNVRRVDSHEEALVLRLGSLQSQVRQAGLVWAFPFPIDEIVPLPTKKSNALRVDSHTFWREPGEENKPLSFIMRGSRGLNPALDGALLTADTGLVHVKWKVTYKIVDVRSYVSNIVSDELEAAEDLIRTMVETVGIHVASALTAEEIVRTRVDFVQTEMTRRINERLTALESGLVITHIEMDEPTPPIPVRQAFDDTQSAENAKQKRIRRAEQGRTTTLNEAAGAVHEELIALLDDIERLERITAERSSASSEEMLEELRAELDDMLENRAEGRAGRAIKDAGSYLSVVVGRMQGDVELYRTLLPEYERNPALLVGRLWEQTRQAIMGYSGVTKIYRPPGTEFRIHIGVDPQQAREEERRRLQDKEFDPSKLRPKRMVPVGPEYD